jgi:hypothetical protein
VRAFANVNRGCVFRFPLMHRLLQLKPNIFSPQLIRFEYVR